MSVADNVALMQRWFQEVWNEGRTETVYELMSPDAVAKGQSGPNDEIHGPKEFEAFVDRIRGAFSDIRIKVEDVVGADDKVVVRWSGVMAHTGDGMGFPATGKTIHVGGISIARVVNGKVVEGWDNWDQLAMLEQLGVYRQPETLLQAAS
jgi:steroid delta-isomerase-like uncharacterized protein